MDIFRQRRICGPFQLNASPYGRLFNDSGSTFCRKHLHHFCLWIEWLEAKFQKNLERFSLLPSIFEHLVLREKKTRNTAEHVIHEKKIFIYARACENKDFTLINILPNDVHVTKTVSSCMNQLVQIGRIKHLLDKKTLLLLII